MQDCSSANGDTECVVHDVGTCTGVCADVEFVGLNNVSVRVDLWFGYGTVDDLYAADGASPLVVIASVDIVGTHAGVKNGEVESVGEGAMPYAVVTEV